VVYGWGEAACWGIGEGGLVSVEGEIAEQGLTLSLPRPATAVYRLRPDGTLAATYEWAGGTSHATMRRFGRSRELPVRPPER
jgi:hypothetical protein